MAVFSSLRVGLNSFRHFLPNNSCILRQNTAGAVCKSPAMKEVVRQMGTHKRMFVITPSRFQWKKTKDVLHFYTMLGIIPLGSLIFLVNVFIGPPELAEIPEGYEPKHWEYYDHPIKRWFSRYVYKSEQEHYEKQLQFICEVEEERHMNLFEKRIRDVMASRDDYKGWYYQPYIGKYKRVVREDYERTAEDYTGQY